jgi:type III secretion protein T
MTEPAWPVDVGHLLTSSLAADASVALHSYETLLVSMMLSLPRIAASLIILPLMTRENVPVMVRNSLCVLLAIIVYPIAFAGIDVNDTASAQFPLLIVKELVIGAGIGFLFGSVFWALSTAGGIIDTQTGMNMANALDPVQGHQATPTSLWLSQFATWLFMASGGFLIFLDVLLGSYKAMPVTAIPSALTFAGASVFINEMAFIMSKALLFAAPAILVLSLIDVGFGLVNRFAQQLNILPLSMPVKLWTATLMMTLTIGVIIEAILRKLADNHALTALVQSALGL